MPFLQKPSRPPAPVLGAGPALAHVVAHVLPGLALWGSLLSPEILGGYFRVGVVGQRGKQKTTPVPRGRPHWGRL